MCLLPAAEGHSAFFVTEQGGQAQDSKLENVYALPQINRREKGFVFHFIQLFRAASVILKKEQPDVVITTGALLSFPFCVLAKLKKKKVVYVESFARVHCRSLTGKLVAPFADLFLVQWETMLQCYPKAKYVGGIY